MLLSAVSAAQPRKRDAHSKRDQHTLTHLNTHDCTHTLTHHGRTVSTKPRTPRQLVALCLAALTFTASPNLKTSQLRLLFLGFPTHPHLCFVASLVTFIHSFSFSYSAPLRLQQAFLERASIGRFGLAVDTLSLERLHGPLARTFSHRAGSHHLEQAILSTLTPPSRHVQQHQGRLSFSPSQRHRAAGG